MVNDYQVAGLAVGGSVGEISELTISVHGNNRGAFLLGLQGALLEL